MLLVVLCQGQTTIQTTKKNGVYVIPNCKINGLKLDFIFDPGAADVSISQTEASFMLKNNYISEDDFLDKASYTTASGEIVEGTTIIIRTLEIGNSKITNVEASVLNSTSAPLLLGQTALKRFGKFSFDYSTNILTLGNSTAIDDQGILTAMVEKRNDGKSIVTCPYCEFFRCCFSEGYFQKGEKYKCTKCGKLWIYPNPSNPNPDNVVNETLLKAMIEKRKDGQYIVTCPYCEFFRCCFSEGYFQKGEKYKCTNCNKLWIFP